MIRRLWVKGYKSLTNVDVQLAPLTVVARVLRTAAERGTTQYVVNTHSPVLPEYFVEQLNSEIVRCWSDGRHTRFEPLELSRTLLTDQEVGDALVEQPVSSFGQRLVRGDFS